MTPSTWLLLWVHLHFPLKCVLPFPINHTGFPVSVSLLKSFLWGDMNPVTTASSWILYWTSLWASSDKVSYSLMWQEFLTGPCCFFILLTFKIYIHNNKIYIHILEYIRSCWKRCILLFIIPFPRGGWENEYIKMHHCII